MKAKYKQENICFISGNSLVPIRVRKPRPYPRTTLEQIDGNIIIQNARSENLWDSIASLGNVRCENVQPTPAVAVSRAPRAKGRKRAGRFDIHRKTVDCNNFRGLIAEAIMGATDANGEVLHLVKWEGKEDMDLVPAIFTTVKFPHVVLAYYENRIKYLCCG